MDNITNEQVKKLNEISGEKPIAAELKGLRSIGLVASVLLKYFLKRELTINDLKVLTALKNITGIGFPYDGDRRQGK